MKRDWKTYNKELVKRGEILIDPETTAVKPRGRKKKKRKTFCLPRTTNNATAISEVCLETSV